MQPEPNEKLQFCNITGNTPKAASVDETMLIIEKWLVIKKALSTIMLGPVLIDLTNQVLNESLTKQPVTVKSNRASVPHITLC